MNPPVQRARAAVEALPSAAGPHYRLGTLLLDQGDWKEAERELARAVELAPEQATYHLALGNAHGAHAKHANPLSGIGIAKSAKAEFEEAVRLDPTLLEAREALMNYHLRAPGLVGGDKHDALAQAEAIEELDPWKGWGYRARALQALGRTAEAVQVLVEATRAYPDTASPWVSLGALRESTDDEAGAREAYEAALERQPDNSLAREGLARIGP